MTQAQYIPDFVEALISEIKNREVPDFITDIDTLYLGGGTPSLLSPAQIFMILDALEERFSLQNCSEFTVEVNPDDVTPGYLRALADVGVNRLSMGIQSFQPELLTFMHRAHTAKEAHRSLEVVAKAGFSSFTADLIYGNPGQTEEQLAEDIRQLLAYQPPHVSAYSLTIEPKTRLGKQFEKGTLQPADETMVAAHMKLTERMLSDAGLKRYEISNYAIPGSEAQHNSNYWQHVSYLGFGPSAHSFIWDGEAPVAQRTANIRNYKIYSTGRYEDETQREILTESELAEERILLGLRTQKGISATLLKTSYNYEWTRAQQQLCEELGRRGLLETNEKGMRLTSEGMALADEITARIIAAH